MRILVLFDLPITTLENKRPYRIFRKYLLKKWVYDDAEIGLLQDCT